MQARPLLVLFSKTPTTGSDYIEPEYTRNLRLESVNRRKNAKQMAMSEIFDAPGRCIEVVK
jgi:hypothetical protein